MEKEIKIKETVERLVLVQDAILGSKYELHEVEVDIESIDIVDELTKTLTEEIKKATDEQ